MEHQVMLPVNNDEYFAMSPSTHLVPCSPFLVQRSGSPAPCVPDIDRFDRRKLLMRKNDLFSANSSPQVPASQTDSQPQTIPFTPTVNDHEECPSKKKTKKIDTPSLEQVVPSCSPCVPLEETTDDKDRTVPTARKAASLTRPLEEKPALQKRQNRSLALPRLQKDKQIDLFQTDDIFSS